MSNYEKIHFTGIKSLIHFYITKYLYVENLGSKQYSI
jgi:hypothetical protein